MVICFHTHPGLYFHTGVFLRFPLNPQPRRFIMFMVVDQLCFAIPGLHGHLAENACARHAPYHWVLFTIFYPINVFNLRAFLLGFTSLFKMTLLLTSETFLVKCWTQLLPCLLCGVRSMTLPFAPTTSSFTLVLRQIALVIPDALLVIGQSAHI